jgi:hypothetical protein
VHDRHVSVSPLRSLAPVRAADDNVESERTAFTTQPRVSFKKREMVQYTENNQRLLVQTLVLMSSRAFRQIRCVTIFGC